MADQNNNTSMNNSTVSETTQATHWADSFDQDTKGWVSGKAWDKLEPNAALAEAIKLGRSAEQKLGVPADQVLRLPGANAKPEDWNSIWSRLGRPEKPEGYEIKPPEGQDATFLNTATTWFHKLGMPKAMAQGLVTEWNSYMAAQQAAEEGRWNQTFDTQLAELQGEWKTDFDKNKDLANRVMRNFGWSADQLKAVEKAIGPKAFLQGFAKFGSAVGEQRFQGEGNKTFSMSSEAAKQRISDLSKDGEFQKKLFSGDADAKAEWTRLHQIAHPEPIAA